ncbi:MAG: 4-hydroxy-2-oxovalerate aldolase [Cetobacterium sp.]
MSKIIFFDSTLRDGSHAIKHQLTKENIESYCKSIDEVGVYCVFVGHGNGLGASSLQVGLSNLSDKEMIETARKNLQRTKLGVFLIPGFGTIENDLKPAIKMGVDVFCIASHCSEADVTKQHIEYLKKENKEVYGVLMMYHMVSVEKILEEAQKIESYGAKGILLMDSAGASTPEMVERVITLLTNNLDIKVGFHSHNNLGLGVSNAYTALKHGAAIVDGTVRGFGAGAGNCQLEALLALLEKQNIKTHMDLYKMLDTSEKIVRKIDKLDKGINSLNIVSGMAGIFSSFVPHIMKATDKFGVDSRDIILELGKRKVVGGQEDVIIEIAKNLKEKKQTDNSIYRIETLS